jgi:hypothetical protein
MPSAANHELLRALVHSMRNYFLSHYLNIYFDDDSRLEDFEKQFDRPIYLCIEFPGAEVTDDLPPRHESVDKKYGNINNNMRIIS